MKSRSRGEGGVTQSVTNSTDRLRECVMKVGGVQKTQKICVTLFMDGPKGGEEGEGGEGGEGPQM